MKAKLHVFLMLELDESGFCFMLCL